MVTEKKLNVPFSSFTYPDSFFSDWLRRNQSHPLYNRELNGKVFYMDQLLVLLEEKAIPEDVYMKTQSGEFQFYIEAQVWDYDLLDSLTI